MTLRFSFIHTLFSLLMLVTSAASLHAAGLFWPTPNRAFTEGKAPEAYLQPTTSGRLESALYGCTRNDGRRFHEGLDLKPIRRDRRGRALDPIFAIAPGVVAHINRIGGNSSYGVYVVIEHRSMDFEYYSLYSHLRSVEEQLRVGAPVAGGQTLGIMGNTSSSIRIPHSHAHLHLEVGVRLNARFDAWYLTQNYTEPNRHGSWNGINLLGIDPLAFFSHLIQRKDDTPLDVFRLLPVTFRVAIHFPRVPDFLERNPACFLSPEATPGPGWYQVGFTRHGLPMEWHQIPDNRIPDGFVKGKIHLVEVIESDAPCTNWFTTRNNRYAPSPRLSRLIDIISAR